MKNMGCRIISGHMRPDRKLVDAFQPFPVANLDDCMNRTAAMHSAIRPMNRAPLLGAAFTVRVPAGDNLMVHKAMDMAEPGDVLVIDAEGYTERAIMGELMVSQCMLRTLAGVVIDGAVRDRDFLATIDFPVYARATSPNGPYKNGPGEIGTIISCGGKTVRPGDIVVGDADGIVCIEPGEAEALLAKVGAVVERETGVKERMRAGISYDRPWVDKKLAEIGCEFVEKNSQTR